MGIPEYGSLAMVITSHMVTPNDHYIPGQARISLIKWKSLRTLQSYHIGFDCECKVRKALRRQPSCWQLESTLFCTIVVLAVWQRPGQSKISHFYIQVCGDSANTISHINILVCDEDRGTRVLHAVSS